MSVYTKITSDEVSKYLEDYSIGLFESLEGISDGIENTNYILKTSKGEYIFTIFENIDINKVIQYLKLMNFLNESNFKCAKVHNRKDDQLCGSIQNKPAAIIEKLSGSSISNVNENQCAEVGGLLANFHILGNGFEDYLKDSRDLTWRKDSYTKLKKVLLPDEKKLIEDALVVQQEFNDFALPKGIIHADLFRDNILFDSGKISGMIDFYYSCSGPFIYDLAVVANDWCIDTHGKIVTEKLRKLKESYSSIKKLNTDERKFWNHALVSASLRFYLSRLLDLHFPKIGEITHIKDPNVFKNILTNHLVNVTQESNDCDN